MSNAVSTSQTAPVVVGIDGSRAYGDTLDLAVEEAERRHAPLLVVHAWPGRYSGRWAGGPIPTEEDGRHLVEIAVRRARHRSPDLEIRTDLVAGGAAGVLARHSAGARLLVVGHRDDALTRHGWGSTAAYLAHHCDCPLLVHRGGAPQRGAGRGGRVRPGDRDRDPGLRVRGGVAVGLAAGGGARVDAAVGTQGDHTGRRDRRVRGRPGRGRP
jgi:nucleotide-binding universal stress UspA family protein